MTERRIRQMLDAGELEGDRDEGGRLEGGLELTEQAESTTRAERDRLITELEAKAVRAVAW